MRKVVVSEFVSLGCVMEDDDGPERIIERRGSRRASGRLFDLLPRRIELGQTGLTETGGVTHLAYRVVRHHSG